jgi:hypothetical protein
MTLLLFTTRASEAGEALPIADQRFDIASAISNPGELPPPFARPTSATRAKAFLFIFNGLALPSTICAYFSSLVRRCGVLHCRADDGDTVPR